MKYTPSQVAKALVGGIVSAGGVAGTLLASDTSALPSWLVGALGLVAALGTMLAVFVTPNELTEEQKEKARAEAPKGIPGPTGTVIDALGDENAPVADPAVVERILKGAQ